MRNFSKVFLLTHTRMNFQVLSMTKNRSEDYEYVDTAFYIPADAKMDGL